MSKPIGKIGSTSAHSETITPQESFVVELVDHSQGSHSQSCSWQMILLVVEDGVHGWPLGLRGLVFFQKKLGST